ncbi:MAG: ice-binding family protein, partial [Desulfuromonadaceae bacterium]|nr:ice-binding family protein [Desulfuromonadaceae bacterium]
VSGTVNEPAKTIAVTMPFGTDVTALVATYTTTGTVVTVGSTTQTSGAAPANNFTTPVVYIVKSADGSTATYTVTVTVALNSAKAITAYSLAGVAGTVNEPAKTITVALPYGTSVTSQVATYTTTGTAVNVGTALQASGTTANNFTTPQAYTVSAADGTTTTTPYTVTVTVAPNSAKAITAFSFVGFTAFPGTVNELAKTISVALPFGTNVTALTANFTTTGTGVKVGATAQTSGAAPTNNFTAPVAYTVTAADGTTATYTVTVTVAPSSAKAITAFSFAGFTGAAGTINELAKTIAVTVPSGTDVTALVATFTATGPIVKVGSAIQTSVATANNFTTPKDYTVTAADLSTATYTVTVTVAPSSLKTITAFSFVGFSAFPGTVNETAKTISVTLPNGTAVTALTAKFTTTGTVVKVGSTVQTSEAPPSNDFTTPKAYTVTAADGTTTTTPYTVTVTVAPSSLKTITAFSFVGFTAFPGTINETAKTISVVLPSGTPVTALTAKFTTTGTLVKIGSTVQTSEAPPTNDFTTTKAYTVTAADGTTTTTPYTVTVTTVQSSLKTIDAFSFVGFTAFPGTINELGKTISVTLPFGTDVTALTAKYTTTGTLVKIGTTVQTSEAPPTNNFTTPKDYTVTAADGTTTTIPYTVTVTLAPNSAKAITAYSFVGFAGTPGTIDEVAKTISVTLPSGTAVTALTAKYTTTGTGVKVGSVVQTSEAPPTNDFTTPQTYRVTAADNTFADYVVTVTVTPVVPPAPPASHLGSAAVNGIMATSAITNTGAATRINGDVAMEPGSSNGLLPVQVNGTIHINDSISHLAYADLLVAYNYYKNLPPGVTISAGADLGALYPGGIPPGTYTSGSSMSINTHLTLDGGGDANAVWVFQIGSSLTTTTPLGSVSLLNGANANNVFWVPTASATIGVGTTFYGTVIAGVSVTGQTGAIINGRLLAGAIGAGTIALDTNTVTVP